MRITGGADPRMPVDDYLKGKKLPQRCILCSSGALPFCTSAPHISIDDASCSFDEPVAPPTPSLPVLPPRVPQRKFRSNSCCKSY